MRVALAGMIVVGACACAALGAAESTWMDGTGGHCQVLDDVTEPVYEIGMTYVPASQFGDEGDSAFLEFDTDWEFAYFRNVLWGEMDLHLKVRNIMFMGSARIDLPDEVAMLALDVGWTARYRNGVSLQLRATPGYYCDLEQIGPDGLFVPFSCSLIRAFTPEVSGIVGAEVRFGFEQLLMPLVGLHWEISDMWRLEVGLPESRFTCFVNDRWHTYLGLTWWNTSFVLEDDRELMTMEDFRAFLGLAHRISGQLQVLGEVGSAFDRSVEFEDADGGVDGADIEDALFVRFALAGLF